MVGQVEVSRVGIRDGLSVDLAVQMEHPGDYDFRPSLHFEHTTLSVRSLTDGSTLVEVPLDQLEQQLVQREYNIKKLELSLEQSFDDLRATKIVAPIQGNLIEIRVQKGAFVKKGQEIGSIFNQLASEVEINLRADLASNVIIGSKVKIKFGRSSYLGRLRGLVKVENTIIRLIKE